MASWIRAFAWVALLAACGEEEESLDCENLPWTYENTGQIFMLNWCTSCHHTEIANEDRHPNNQGVNLETYDGFIDNLERIEERALSSAPTMPPSGGLPGDEVERLRQWIECGMPE